MTILNRDSNGRFKKGHTETRDEHNWNWKGGISKIKDYRIKKLTELRRKRGMSIMGSLEYREKMSKALKNRVSLFPMLSKHHSEETKEKISKTFKKNYKKENHPNWRGGITPLEKMIRNLPENKEWIRNIFKRDNYTCQKCLKEIHDLEAHHIIPFSIIFQEFLQQYSQFSPIEDKETLARLAITYQPFWDIENGITYCEECHRVFSYSELTKRHPVA